MRIKTLSLVVIFFITSPIIFAQSAATQNSTTYDADGTAHITRTVPPPAMVSPEARAYLATFATKKPRSQDVAERRKGNDAFRIKAAEEAKSVIDKFLNVRNSLKQMQPAMELWKEKYFFSGGASPAELIAQEIVSSTFSTN